MQCVIWGRSRTTEPTPTAERWFLSVCYPKAKLRPRPEVKARAGAFPFLRGGIDDAPGDVARIVRGRFPAG